MSLSVLIVEDDDPIRVPLKEFLEEEGFEVHAARNGREALAVLSRIAPPGLILLDLMMPLMSGSEFLAERRHDRRLRDIPVVIMSAWMHRWTGQAVGVDNVLSKPVNSDQLLALVSRYCKNGSQVSENA